MSSIKIKVEMTGSYHTIVIGAGISGSSAARILA